MVWRKKSGSSESSPGVSPCYDDEGKKAPRGHVPVVTSSGERVVLPVRLLADPEIAELLDMAAQRYGCDQPGVLRIPCAAEHLRRVIDRALQRADRLGGRV